MQQRGLQCRAALASANGTAETGEVRRQRGQRGQVLKPQRTGQADHHAACTHRLDEGLQRVGVHHVEQAAGALVGGIGHQPGKAELQCVSDQGGFDAAVGDEHRHHRAAAVGQPAEHRCRLGPALDADLDIVDAALAHRMHLCLDGRQVVHRQVADGGADRQLAAPATQRLDDLEDRRHRQPAERAAARFLQIDEVGTAGGCRQGLVDAAHADQQADHGGEVSRWWRTASCSQRQASCSPGPAVLSIAICR